MDYKEFKEFIDRVYRFVKDNCHMDSVCSDCSDCILSYPNGRCVLSDIGNMTKKQFEMVQKYDRVDWSKVPVDTKIYVWNTNPSAKRPRYFAGYIDGRVYAWSNGRTSFSSLNSDDIDSWANAELCEPREGDQNGHT